MVRDRKITNLLVPSQKASLQVLLSDYGFNKAALITNLILKVNKAKFHQQILRMQLRSKGDLDR